jgi:hypothetical protein
MSEQAVDGERQRGRIVLQLGCGQPSAVALEAAVRVARAFECEVESVFVEDEQLFDCLGYPFACEVSLSGLERRALSHDEITRELHFAAQASRRQLEKLARSAEVPLRSRVVRDAPLRALALACRGCAGSTVLALGQPYTGGQGQTVKELLEGVAEAAAFLLVGPQARNAAGPVIVALEDTADLNSMLGIAERIGARDESEIVLLLIGGDGERLHWMEGEARIALEDRQGVRIETAKPRAGGTAALAETLRRLRGGFLVGRLGGLLVPDDRGLRALAAALDCPLLLMR